jgi:hypothetical protein
MAALESIEKAPSASGSGELPPPALLVPIKGRDGGVKAYVAVEEADYNWASQFKWFLARDGYVYRNRSHRTEEPGHIALHRELMGLTKGDGKQVDHKNRRKLDCCRSNLRVVEEDGHNKQNVPARKNALSKHRGVSFYRPTNKWRGRVMLNGREYSAGYHTTEEEAAKAAAELRKRLMPYALD